MTNFTFRGSTPQDWEPVKNLLLRCALPFDGARDHFASFLLACDDGRLIACGGLEYHEDVALLRSVAVESSHRGLGLGKSLIAELLAAAASRRIGSIVLLTTTAEDFFPRMGFSTVPRSSLPKAVMASEEFKGACPDTATAMLLRLRIGPNGTLLL